MQVAEPTTHQPTPTFGLGAAAPDAIVAKTADAFQQIQPDYFVPMHCTGFYPALMIEHVLPRRVVEPSSGTHIVFGA